MKYFALELKDLGLEKGDNLILFSETRPEWVMADLACLCSGGITVPVYPTLTPEQIKYIINNSDAEVVVCSNQELWQKVEAVKAELDKARHFICFESVDHAEILSFDLVSERGKKKSRENPELFEKMAFP